MQINATVVSVENNVEITKKDGGTYQGSRLSYRGADGKLAEQAFHNNVLKFNPKVKNALDGISPGDAITIIKEKKGEFWNVTDLIKGTAPAEAAPQAAAGGNKGYVAPKSTYETPEERAKKQVYIVRQSSITAALTMLGSKAKDVATVIEVAKQFEDYVFDRGEQKQYTDDVADIESDDID